jgi:hypothetical protein
MKSIVWSRAALLRMTVAVMLDYLTLLATDYAGNAQQISDSGRSLAAKCAAQLRKCNSHCNLVYESKRALRVCRGRCEDNYFVCKVNLTRSCDAHSVA